MGTSSRPIIFPYHMTMDREKYKKIFLFIYIGIVFLSIILIVFNLDSISVIHAKEGNLPSLKYETYTSLEISLLYVLILMTLINIFLMWTERFEKYSQQIISLTPIVVLIAILLFAINPHSIILFPTGAPPTTLDFLNIGGYFIIFLSGFFVIVTFSFIYLEGNLLKYLLSIIIVIGALLLSDFIHESGHAVFILLSGGKVNEFYPFPVLLGGEFAAGYVGYKNVPTNLEPLVFLGGEIFQWITIAIIILILWRIRPSGKLQIFFLILLVISWLDFPLYVLNNSIGLPHWFLIGSVNGDIIIFCEKTGFPLYVMIIFACIQLALGMFIILKKKLGGGKYKKQ